MTTAPPPPRLGRWLLRLQALGDSRESVEADLAELYAARVSERGKTYAALRYYADVVSLRRYPRPTVLSADRRRRPFSDRARALLADVRQDVVYATRLGRRRPTFALVAMLSLAFGVGANTFVFSVINALVLRPLPVDQPARLVFVQPRDGITLSFPVYRDLRDRNDTLSGVIGYRQVPLSLDRQDMAARAWGYLVTGNYFDTLGLAPAAGRFFHQSEDQPPAPSPVAVLSYDCWMSRFAGDPGVVGATIRLNGQPYEVLGVAPRGFIGTELIYRPEVWVPMTMQPQIEARASWLDARRTQNTLVVGRLKPGVSRAQAESNLRVIAAALARENPQSDDGLDLVLSEPGLVGNALRTPVEAFTLGVLVLAGLTLLMACVNLAVVLTARGADRHRELAIRLSIGAGAGRLGRQLLTETLLLSCAGGAAGLAVATAAARALSAWRLPIELPVQFDVPVDARVFLFALGVSIAAGLLFGLAPARQAARTDPNGALKGLDPGVVTPRRWALRDLLVALQVALCVVLITGCLLALRGLQRAMTMPIGMELRGVMVVGFDVGLAGYDEAHGRDFERRALEAVRTLPGIDTAAYSDTLPLNIDQSSTSVLPEDRADIKASEAPRASRYRASPGFFRTMGIRMRQGRDIDARDSMDTPAVAVINETFAREILRTPTPVGRRFRYGWSGAWIEVVGVVEDGKYLSLDEPPRAAVFEAVAQHYTSTVTLVARTSMPPDRAVAAMRAAIGGLDPRLPLYEAGPVDATLAAVLLPSRVASVALGAFGVLALLLAVTGLHGVVTNAVASRQKEIGIRIAIGATPRQVIRLVLSRTLALLGIGAAAGALLVALTGRLLSSVVFDVSPGDPVVLTAVAASLIGVGALSCWAPVRRALGVNPTDALRTQ
ncbi:MAG: ADOP family duplicated permease [Vicinamibacterales bacterium]